MPGFPHDRLSHLRFESLTYSLNVAVQIAFKDSLIRLPRAILAVQEKILMYWRDFVDEIYNGPIVSVRDITIAHDRRIPATAVDDQVTIDCAAGNYFQALVSNLALDVKLEDQLSLRELLQKSSNNLGYRYFEASKPFLDKHTLFPLANPLKIAVAVTTKDDCLIVTRRSRHKSLAIDRGCLYNAVGTRLKCCNQRFMLNDKPSVKMSALQGMADEIGDRLTALCTPLVCTGIVLSSSHFMPAALMETNCAVSAEDFIRLWLDSEVRDRHEVEEMSVIDITKPEPLLNSICNETWSNVHAACALHVLLQRFPKQIRDAGYSLT